MKPIDQIMARVEKRDMGHGTPCWLWTGPKTGEYGRCSIRGVDASVHRATYQALVGPVPDGLQLDHLCYVRSCCNPAHLEPVTKSENVRRALAYDRKTHCYRGHELNEATLYARPNNGVKQCRICDKLTHRLRVLLARGEGRLTVSHVAEIAAIRESLVAPTKRGNPVPTPSASL